jgi:predicted NAD/FAD-binding protein
MPESPQFDKRSVAVIGGGIAGITAAAKLFQQGYNVTLFEKAEKLGGNLSSNSPDNEGGTQEVYPHIFGDWYGEFWYLLENDFGLKRSELFVRRDEVRMAIIPADNRKLEKFGEVHFATVSTPTSLTNLVETCHSGVLSPRDMFLFGYSYLDLVSVPSTAKRTSKLLADLDVTGYLYSRPFMNNEIAEFHDDILKVIWSMPSDDTSAKAYQKLLRHTLTFPKETPFAWLIRGPLNETLIDKMQAALERGVDGQRKVRIRTKTEVVAIALDEDDQHVKVTLAGADSTETFRYAVIATPPRVAGQLAVGPEDGYQNSLVRRQPRLARLREARSGRIPVVYLHFSEAFLDEHKDDLKALPNELTGFKQLKPTEQEKLALAGIPRPGEGYDISIHNIASFWDDPKKPRANKDNPVLVLAASHAEGIKARGPEEDSKDLGKAQGHAMIKRLHGYLPFIKPGKFWGDKDSSIDWEETRVITNKDYRLFLNDTGSNEWRPAAKIQDDHGKLLCRNVFFAGDYCMTDVDMATVEAAVQSGVLAAQSLQWQDRGDTPIRMQPHTVYSSQALLLAKLVSTPAAYAAALDAIYEEASDNPVAAITFPYTALVMATSYWADWLRSAVQLGRHVLPGSDELNPGPVGSSGRHDRKIGILGMARNLAWALATEGPGVAPQLRDDVAEVLYRAWYLYGGRTMFPGVRSTFKDPTKASATTPRTEDRDDADMATTWSGLLRKGLGKGQLTPDTVSNVAFAGASAALHFAQNVGKADSSGKPTSVATQLRASIDHGCKAGRLKAGAYVRYDIVQKLPPPPPPQLPSPNSV